MMPKTKKAKVAESGEGEGSGHIDEELVRSISEIKYIQTELNKIKVEEDDKVLEVLQEYSELRREIYTRRNEVLLTFADFWFTVLNNHRIFRGFLSVEDQKILRYLVSLDVEERPKLGYSITFNFSPNPYFENKKLTKTFSFPDQATAVVTGATINWKEGLEKKLEDMSFFMWFSRSEQIPFSAAALDKVACTIKECLWPDPLKCIIDVSLILEYIIENTGLEGEGGVQDVDEEGGEFDADGDGLDNEIEEQKGDEEGGEIGAEEGGQEDDEIEVQEQDEQGGQGDAVIEQDDDEEGGAS